MNTNYNREAFVRSLEKLCLLHRGIFAFSEDVIYDVKKPVYTFEAYGNSNEHLNGRYDTNPIFDKNAYMLDVNVTGLTSNLSDITEGYELWLLDDMTLAVTYFYNMKVRSKDKFEAVTYRFFMKDGLYKFGYDFEEDAFLGRIEYIIAKELCCNTECDNKCDECKYGEIISEYEDDYDDECIGDECDDCPYKDKCTL